MARDQGQLWPERRQKGPWRRRVVIALVGAIAFFAPFATVLWLIPPAVNVTKLPAPNLPPLKPIARTSVIVAPAAISLSAIGQAMERAAPKSLTGRREGDGRNVPIVGDIGWTVSRGALAVSGRSQELQVSAPLGGTLQVRGNLQQISGALGDRVTSFLGGNLGRQVQDLAGKTIDQKFDVRGNATVTSRPAILPNWRIAPNLEGEASIADVAVPVAGVRLSVSNEVKPLLDRAVREQIGLLETRVRNDPLLEATARREWTKMCRSIPLGSARAGMPNLWLEVRPTRAAAAQPRVDDKALNLVLAVEAQTRIVPAETTPTCPFPSVLEIVPQLGRGGVKIAVPIDLPFAEINKLLAPQLANRKFPEDDSGAIEAIVQHAALSASGDRLLISLLVNAREKKSWFSFGAEATVHVWGRPVLDPARQTLRLSDLEIDVSSDAAFGLLGAAAEAAKPQLRSALAERAVVDLKPFAADAKRRIDAVLADFRGQQGGVKVNTSISDLRLVGIDYDATTLRVIAEAEGTVDIAVTSLAID